MVGGVCRSLFLLNVALSFDEMGWLFFCYRECLSLVVRKPAFCECENKDAAVTAQLISDFVFATWLVRSLFYLNQKFQASSHLQWLYSLVCVRPGRKPRRLVFSQRGSFFFGRVASSSSCLELSAPFDYGRPCEFRFVLFLQK